MNFYNNTSNLQDWEQTVRVTLQCGPYKGHIAFQVIGNQYGKNILCFYPDQLTQREIEAFVENTCNMEIDPTRRFLHFDLHSEGAGQHPALYVPLHGQEDRQHDCGNGDYRVQTT